jgi:hypothetical protein
MILRFGLFIEVVSSCIFPSHVLSCLTNSALVFPLISILSSSSEIMSSTYCSLLEWPSIVFYISVSFSFLRFSLLWVNSSLILLIVILNSFIYLWCSLFHFVIYLGLLWVHVFVFVSYHILYFFCLGISWVPPVHFSWPCLVTATWNSQQLFERFLLSECSCGLHWVPWSSLSVLL